MVPTNDRIFLLLFAAALLSGSAALGQIPTINPITDDIPGLSQDIAQIGTGPFMLTVRGSNFTSNSMVKLGQSNLTTMFVDAKTLIATVPASLIKSLGTLLVSVVDGAQFSNSVNLKVATRSDANASGTVNIGDALVIARSVGGLVRPPVSASLGDVNLNESITIGDALVVALFVGGISTNLSTPLITSTNVTATAAAGDTIIITGAGFSGTAANNVVMFPRANGTFTSTAASSVSSDRTMLTLTIPTDAVSGPIFVKRSDLGLPGQPFVLPISNSIVPVYISKVTPAVGLVAGTTIITISGTGFSPTAGNNIVTFSTASGTTSGIVSNATATSLRVTIPVTAVSGFISVTVGNNTSNKKSILVSGTATNLGLNQVYYPDVAGEPILIEGTGFNVETPAENQVIFTDSGNNDIPGIVVTAGPTELIALVPAGAVSGNLKIKTGVIMSNTITYTAAQSQQIVSGNCQTIQDAINALPSSGGQLTIQSGTYTCLTPIVIDRDNVDLRGSGISTLLQAGSGTNIPVLVIGQTSTPAVTTRRNIHVSDLAIDGNRLNQDRSPSGECWGGPCGSAGTASVRNNGITIRNSTDVIIERVTVYRGRSGGLVTEKGSRRLTVRDFTTYDNEFDGVASYETENSIFTNIYSYNNVAAGVSLDIQFNYNLLSNLILTGNGSQGIFMRDSRNNTFQNVEVRTCGQQGLFLAQVDTNVNTPAAGNMFIGITVSGCPIGIRVNDASCVDNILDNSHFVGFGSNTASCISDPHGILANRFSLCR